MPFQHQARSRQSQAAPSLSLPTLAWFALASFAAAMDLAACENVASFTQPSLVRVIDASYVAPAINVDVENSLLAANIGQGTITPYGTLAASPTAIVSITAATGGASLLKTTAALVAGQQSSIFLTDSAAAPSGFQVALLQDQQVAAPSGHSAFRFLNQALKTGAVDVYMIPSGATMANTIPLVTALPVGAAPSYSSFSSQTVTMVITPTGLTKPSYTSAPLALTGGEVRTVLIVNAQLTTNPPITAYIANDVN